MNNQMQAIHSARDYIQSKTQLVPEIAIVLGSGLGGLADDVEIDVSIPYSDIPGFAQSTVHGHAGELILGTLAGRNVVMMKGRLHYYEGHPMSDVIFPIRVMRVLGAKMLVVTNAAGGLNPDFTPGNIMLITDHINMQWNNALIGPNLDELGPRFPDMTHVYTPELRQLALKVAEQEEIAVQQGIYVAWSGPTYETPAERRFLRLIGGDAVGMSTVPEATAANHAGMKILGFSVITNVATGGPDQPVDDHLEVLAMANAAGKRMVQLVSRILDELPPL